MLIEKMCQIIEEEELNVEYFLFKSKETTGNERIFACDIYHEYGDIIAGKGLTIIEAFEEAYKKYKEFKA